MKIIFNANSNENLLSDIFNDIDRYFTHFIQKLSNDKSIELTIALLLLSYQTGKGNTCISIPDLSCKNIHDIIESPETESFLLPDKKIWINKLKKSNVVGAPGDFKPIILDKKGRLYLFKYCNYEKTLADNIKKRLEIKLVGPDLKVLSKGIGRLFGEKNKNDIDWQSISAISALKTNFGIISGGPGTGKTTIIIKIISLLLEQAFLKNEKILIALAAPTGKAAVRLKESIVKIISTIDVSDDIKSLIPTETFTIHRLLGPISGSPFFYYNEKNKIPYDIIIIDESSMVDLALMVKLFKAVPDDSKIYLFGDMNQLSSIDTGEVFSDICYAADPDYYSDNFKNDIKKITGFSIPEIRHGSKNLLLSNSINVLKKNYRFRKGSGISMASKAIQEGDYNRAIQLFTDDEYKDISIQDNKFFSSMNNTLVNYTINQFKHLMECDSPGKGLEFMSGFTMLCALRQGPFGVEIINNRIEHILKKYGYIINVNGLYNNRPIIVTKNDYNKNLFNGDMGIVSIDTKKNDEPRIFFPDIDTLNSFLPSQLPEHETVYAMTIHKSQGSEFDNVHIILPDRISEILTRELLYTAVTRAKLSVTIYSSINILRNTIKNRVKRLSGLKDALW